MHSQVALHFAQACFDLGPQFGLRILLQQSLQTLFSFARVRDVAIRQAHLAHFGFRNLHHRSVGKRIGGKVSQPILISLARLNQRTRAAFQIK